MLLAVCWVSTPGPAERATGLQTVTQLISGECLAPFYTARDEFESTLARFAKLAQSDGPAKTPNIAELEKDLNHLSITYDQIRSGFVGKIKYTDWIGKRPDMVDMIFSATSGKVVPMDSFESRDRARLYTNLIRSRPLGDIKKTLEVYADKYLDGKEKEHALYVLKALRKKHQDMARHDFLVKKLGKRRNPSLSPANEDELYYMNSFKQLLYKVVNASYYAQFRQYNRAGEIYDVAFWNLPIWSVDERGRIDRSLMEDWIGLNRRLPGRKWQSLLREGKLKSLAQISGVSDVPQSTVTVPESVQLSLFDSYLIFSADIATAA